MDAGGSLSRSGEFFTGLDREISAVFANHPELVDHRVEFPWLTGCLGDPYSPVWFVAENPSLTQVRKLRGLTSPEVQWSVSPGDKLLRQALYKAGFKIGDPAAPGGWRCWITDVIKSADVVKEWQQRSEQWKLRVAEAWAPVLAHELKQGQPRQLVVLGGNADKLLGHLESRGFVPELPPRKRIHHYSYLGSYPAKDRGPGDPGRVAEWEAEFVRVADLLDT